MKDLPLYKIIVLCTIFLAVIYLTASLDLGVISVLITSILFFKFQSVWLFLSALALFFLHLLFLFISLKFPVIFDLSVSSYILLLSGILVKKIKREKDSWEVIIPYKEKTVITQNDLLKTGSLLFLVLLIYPVAGGHLALILGYAGFVFLFHIASDGRYAFSLALLFLVLCPFLLIANKEKVAENSAIFTYYFLVIGVLQEISGLVKNREKVPVVPTRHHILTRRDGSYIRKIKLPEIKGKTILKYLIPFIVIVVLIGGGIYAVSERNKKELIKVVSDNPDVLAPNIQKISSLSSQLLNADNTMLNLRIRVLNGTNIKFLAASTAATLRKAGFRNVTTDNTYKDVTKWQISQRDKNRDYMEVFKRILNLSDMENVSASIPANIDVVIVAGTQK